MKVEELVSDEALDNAWGNANFGDSPRREVLANAVLKYASGYTTGHTILAICLELYLVTKSKSNLTLKGKRYLYAAFKDKLSV